MSAIGYYPGCSLRGTAAEYDRSLQAVASCLGVELQEIPDWVCCGATSAHAIDHASMLALAADTLAKARKAGIDKILAPCAMCYQRLAAAVQEFAAKPEVARLAMQALGESPALDVQKIEALSLLQWLEQIPRETITKLVTKPLTGMKVACYYGCLLVRPTKVTGEKEVEAPRAMERVLAALGAETVRWSMAVECCGASFALSRKDVVLRQGEKIVDAARRAGATAICLACPMCQANLDMRQAEFVAHGQSSLPIVYLTQLLGAAFGLGADALGFKGHFVPVQLPATEARVPCPA
jgi:heterodisulfide reductase subunit B2